MCASVRLPEIGLIRKVNLRLIRLDEIHITKLLRKLSGSFGTLLRLKAEVQVRENTLGSIQNIVVVARNGPKFCFTGRGVIY